jgi:hypothetical protein
MPLHIFDGGPKSLTYWELRRLKDLPAHEPQDKRAKLLRFD